jgi:hypothetical protein
MDGCKYKYSLGVPARGAHFHVGGIAIVDMLMTIIAAVILARMTNQNVIAIFILLMILATFLHWYFCVPTALTSLII